MAMAVRVAARSAGLRLQLLVPAARAPSVLRVLVLTAGPPRAQAAALAALAVPEGWLATLGWTLQGPPRIVPAEPALCHPHVLRPAMGACDKGVGAQHGGAQHGGARGFWMTWTCACWWWWWGR